MTPAVIIPVAASSISNEEMENIYKQYSARVTGYITSRVACQADADDLVAEVFEKLYMKIASYDSSKSSMSTWIFTITRNTLTDFFRRCRPWEELHDNILSDEMVDDALLSEETLNELAEALKRLPQEQNSIVVMYYYDRLPLTEVAAKLDLSYGAVKIRHQKSLQALRENMYKHFFSDITADV